MSYRPGDFLALPDVAETLGCSRQTVYRLLASDELQGLQLRDHGWWRVSKRSLDQYVERRMSPKRQRTPSATGGKKRNQGRK